MDIQVFSIDESKLATCWRNSLGKYSTDRLLNLNVSITPNGLAHYSYIRHFEQYAHRYSCPNCERLFKTKEKYNTHVKYHCNNGKTNHKFPGGVFKLKSTIFDYLLEIDIDIPRELQRCPYFAVFDFESLLLKRTRQTTAHLAFTHEHQPVSCAIHTNIPGFQPKCFINDNPDQLVQNLLTYLEDIQCAQKEILESQFQPMFDELDSTTQESQQYIQKLITLQQDHNREKGFLNFLHRSRSKLTVYCNQLTCLGFNSRKYDINLIKRNLYPILVVKGREKEIPSWPHIIDRNGTVLALYTETLKFLDVSNYIAPGFSLDVFMRSHGAQLTKAKFPYEYLDSYSKLNETALPPPNPFYSKLREECISEKDYTECVHYWKENKMQTLGDYQQFYNLWDVIAFLESCITMANLYWSRFQIDIFREAMSLPGVTERYLFKSIPNTRFSLFSENSKDIYYMLKSSMKGGLSMVMTRLAIKDQTYIHKNAKKPVKTVIGLDFNALYLWAQPQDTPTGYYYKWILQSDERFKKVTSSSPISIKWLDYQSEKIGYFIQHNGNAKEKCIGKAFTC